MKNLYYQLVDMTRKNNDPNSATFGYLSANSDFAGLVSSLAEHNGIGVNDVRLYFYPTKQIWKQMCLDWVKGVDWSIPLLMRP